jgi:RimJ/RimL family protein N-acetyltransferase
MEKPHVVTLRATRASDLDELFRFQLDERANRMAAFTSTDPSDRSAFDAHWRHLLDSPDIDVRTVRADGVIVGSVARWFEDGAAEVTSWVDPAMWGQGIATRAMQLFLDSLRERPVRARVAADNIGSVRVLERLGFMRHGTERSFARARGRAIDEFVYQLD